MMTKVRDLLDKGVTIPNPETVEIGPEVDIDRISGNSVALYSGSRIYGNSTLILRGARLGYEGPATIEDCQLGPYVELKGGFFKKAVFLEKAQMGMGAHVRDGTILEEEAGGAHTVGLKQTVLFPFVTLGSLINFCDCLMAGGTSRKDHSEVGSSYIHFNYTPNQDKATPSLLGDVPRGVMLNQRPIFLGGQGGMVGPCRLEFGSVTAAGAICRKDELRPDRLILGEGTRTGSIPFIRSSYSTIQRIVANNTVYIANLIALSGWYREVRKLFVSEDFPEPLWKGLLEKADGALEERIHRFEDLCRKMPEAVKIDSFLIRQKKELYEKRQEVIRCFQEGRKWTGDVGLRDRFLEIISKTIGARGKNYLPVIQNLRLEDSKVGTRWLQGIVDQVIREVSLLIPSFKLEVSGFSVQVSGSAPGPAADT